jgi:hypothetical protein
MRTRNKQRRSGDRREQRGTRTEMQGSAQDNQ